MAVRGFTQDLNLLTTKKISKFRYQGGQLIKAEDAVIVEQPLQIVISASDSSEKPIVYTITYRTPGEDQNLITGLLLSEGVIYESSDIETLEIEPD